MHRLGHLSRALCIAGLVSMIHLSAAAATTEERFNAALQQYETSHYRDAYERLAALADEGHSEAARIATLMSRFGAQLYGGDLDATAERKSAWARIASRSNARLVAEAGR